LSTRKAKGFGWLKRDSKGNGLAFHRFFAITTQAKTPKAASSCSEEIATG
jgi:hypothetical protein